MANSKSYYRKCKFIFCFFTLPLNFWALCAEGRAATLDAPAQGAAVSLQLPGDFEPPLTAELGRAFSLGDNTLLRPFASYELLSVHQENLLDGYGAYSSHVQGYQQNAGRVKIGAGAAWQDGRLFLGGKVYLAESLDGDEEGQATWTGYEFGAGRALGASLQGGFNLNERFSVSAGVGAEQTDIDLAKEARLRFELKF